MGKHGRAAHKLRQARHRLLGRGGFRHVRVGNVRERLDVLGNGLTGIHECPEGVNGIPS